MPASLLLQEQDAVASSGKSSDVQFREYMASGLVVRELHLLRPALGNTWAHSVNTRLFLDVNAAGSNHGSLRSIHITKSPTAPYSSVPFQLGAAGIMESRAQDAPDCNGRQPHSIQNEPNLGESGQQLMGRMAPSTSNSIICTVSVSRRRRHPVSDV